MMKISVLAHRCAKGDLTEELVWDVVEETQIAATIKRITRDEDIIKFGVTLTPTVVIEGEIKAMGKIPEREKLVSWLMQHRNKQEMAI
jgi:small redox-active disulfide protein 2